MIVLTPENTHLVTYSLSQAQRLELNSLGHTHPDCTELFWKYRREIARRDVIPIVVALMPRPVRIGWIQQVLLSSDTCARVPEVYMSPRVRLNTLPERVNKFLAEEESIVSGRTRRWKIGFWMTRRPAEAVPGIHRFYDLVRDHISEAYTPKELAAFIKLNGLQQQTWSGLCRRVGLDDETPWYIVQDKLTEMAES